MGVEETMSLSSNEIKEILEILDGSGWEEAQLTVGDTTLVVSNSGTLPTPAAPPPPPAAPAAAPVDSAAGGAVGGPISEEALATGGDGGSPAATGPAAESTGVVVEAPSVGVFWRSPEPGAAAFVEVGDAVEAGQTLCIVEVMKLMQHVAAEVAGTIAEIHVSNSEHVEYGTPLFSIAPAA
jgi:acetyl-CoA carboxylase biotin carboxyl carrier protein